MVLDQSLGAYPSMRRRTPGAIVALRWLSVWLPQSAPRPDGPGPGQEPGAGYDGLGPRPRLGQTPVLTQTQTHGPDPDPMFLVFSI